MIIYVLYNNEWNVAIIISTSMLVQIAKESSFVISLIVKLH